jgi:uncharacterized protein DUF6687
MELPVRILRQAPEGRVISVDGAFDAPGLNLSHWPGNTTPDRLKRDTSTGIALAFARLPRAEQDELARGCTLIVNNHYDTDGSCALLAVRHPELALPREAALLEAATAGDFFQLPSERGLIVDAIVEGLVDPERSPIAGRFESASARTQVATEFLLEELPAILDGELAPYRALWEPALECTRADLRDLARCARDDIVHLDWTVWTAPRGAASSSPDIAGGAEFDPGRHALFGSSKCDRALVVAPGAGGATYRLLFSSLSWFDLATRAPQPRPVLAELAGGLNALEGTSPSDEAAWRCEHEASPSPELWFGTEGFESFSERNAHLRESTLAPAVVRRAIADALRARLPLPA